MLSTWSDLGRALARTGAAAACAGLLASCGGGDTTSNFRPSRIIAFGDETSLIVDVNGDADGAKYSVNAVVSTTDTTLVCTADLIWVQTLATRYSLVFPECNPEPGAVNSPTSRIRATLGAKAADLSTQIDAQLSEGPFRDGDMVTVLVGENDVIDQYTQYPTLSEPQIAANLAAAGAEVAKQVNRLADAGAKVIVSTIVDVGVTPYALNERATHIDIDRAAMLTRLTSSFNASLRGTIANDGRRIGLVVLDELVTTVAQVFGLDGFLNVTNGACDLAQSQLSPPSILDCTELTVLPGNSSISNLWADDRHLSAGGQLSLGNLAVSRAQNNPF